MKYLVKRGDVYHFRAFYPADLVQFGSPKEYTRSLRTTDYAEAIRKRNQSRVEFDQHVATLRSRRDGSYTVLDDLTHDQEIALAQDVYRHLLPEVEKARVAMAAHPHDVRPEVIEGERAYLQLAEEDAVLGDDFFGMINTLTNWVLDRRMLRIKSPEAMSRLGSRIGSAIVQNRHDRLAAMQGRPPERVDPRFVDPSTLTPRQPTPMPQSSNNGYNMSDLLKKFRESVADTRGEKGRRSIDYTSRMMVEYFGADFDVRNLRRQQVMEFRALLMRVPSNAAKRYPGLPITAVVERRDPAHTVLSVESVNKNLANVAQFVNWMHLCEVISNPPILRGITLDNQVQENLRRLPFTLEQLELVFTSPMMRQAARERSIYFWCFAIGLYHGLRLNEIASLAPEHITQNEIPTITIAAPKALITGERKGRSKVITRFFPMHPILVELGLHEFAAGRAGFEMLFSDAVKGTDGYFSDEISDWTREMLDSVGINAGGPTFHSLRHNFRNVTSTGGIDDKMVMFLGGWKQSGIMNRHYLSAPGQAEVLAKLASITYGQIDKLVLKLKPTT
jgi:integrase